MFAESIVTQSNRTPWSLAVSLTLQCALVGAVLLVSVLHVEKLSFDLMKPVPLSVPYMKPPSIDVIGTIRERSSTSTAALTVPRPFVEPSRISTGIAEIHDVGVEALQLGAEHLGVAGSGPIGLVGMIGDTGIATPAPPQPARPQAQAPPEKPRLIG